MKDHAGAISAWIAIAVALCGLVAKFSSLDEWKDTSRTQIADHGRRIDAIERDKSTMQKFNDLQVSIEKLQWKVDALSEQLAEKRHVR